MKSHSEPDRWPLVYIIILNWNQLELTLDCLDSLAALKYPRFEIIVVDNGSANGSAVAIRSRYPAVAVIENEENLGFSEGNNTGIRYALAQGVDYVLLLNNDTVVDRFFLTELIRVAEADPQIGIVGSKMYYFDQPETIWCAGGVINWSSGGTTRLQAEQLDMHAEHEQPRAVDFVAACAMAVKRQVIDEVGLLDPRYFIYYDETDWCVRAVARGYRVVHVPSSKIWHKVSAAMGAVSPATDYYMNRNVLLFLGKNQRGLARMRSLLLAAGRNLVTIAAYTLKPHDGQRLPHRNTRLLALRDAALGRWGRMGDDVAAACCPDSRGSI